MLPVVGCPNDDDEDARDAGANAGRGGGASAGRGAGGSTGSLDGECTTIPEETAGPYPGDGTNNGGLSALALSGIVRSDITASIGDANGTAEGIALTIKLSLVNAKDGCSALTGHAIYLWHCDRAGAYSMYSGSASAENYLRGVQASDADGVVTFKSIFPACYSGRWPHIHFEVYESLATATHGKQALATSQLAMPKDACTDAFKATGYETSVRNFAMVSLDTDMVFRDGVSLELATVEGSVEAGYTASLRLAV